MRRELTREAVWEAMRARRTYATNGERIYLKTSCGEALMGEAVEAEGSPTIKVEVHGTAPLLDVELKRGIKTIHRHPVNAGSEAAGRSRRIRVQWSGVTQKSGRDKKVEWRGGIALDKGAMLTHTPYALNQYDDAITRVSNKLLRFTTATSGDPDGVLIDVDAPADAVLSFFSNVKSFTLPLGEISTEPTIIEAGGVNIQILVGRSRADPQGLERALSVHRRGRLPRRRQPLLGARPASRRRPGLVESDICEVCGVIFP